MKTLGYLPLIQEDGSIKLFEFVKESDGVQQTRPTYRVPDAVRVTVETMFPDSEFRLEIDDGS